MKRRDYTEMNELGLAINSESKVLQKNGSHVSRRSFTKGVSHIIGLGAFSHFSLLAGKALADEPNYAGDDCPGGGDADDECSNVNPDRCPGGNMPEDHCPTGATSEDECPGELPPTDFCSEPGLLENDQCYIGVHTADECDMNHHSADQCESGLDGQDKCPADGGDSYTDKCPGGARPHDICPDDGGIEVDMCPGGGADVDTCDENKNGDECPFSHSSGNGDNCNELQTDRCYFYLIPPQWADDVCTTGINTATGNGYDDKCGEVMGINDIRGNDVCIDGSNAQDHCYMISEQTKEPDICPGGGICVDVCAPDDPNIRSDDYCLAGHPETDECKPSVGDRDECPGGVYQEDACSAPGDEDECPGGTWEVDDCPTGDAPEDECTAAGGCTGGDQEFSFPTVDMCDDTCALPSADTAE